MTKKPAYESIRKIPFYQLVAMSTEELIKLEETIAIEIQLNEWIAEKSMNSVQRAKLALKWVKGTHASHRWRK